MDTCSSDRNNWYYADADQQPIGPITFSQLQHLAKTGIVSSSTFVICEGDTEWKSFAIAALPEVPKAVQAPQPPPIPGQVYNEIKNAVSEKQNKKLLIVTGQKLKRGSLSVFWHEKLNNLQRIALGTVVFLMVIFIDIKLFNKNFFDEIAGA